MYVKACFTILRSNFKENVEHIFKTLQHFFPGVLTNCQQLKYGDNPAHPFRSLTFPSLSVVYTFVCSFYERTCLSWSCIRRKARYFVVVPNGTERGIPLGFPRVFFSAISTFSLSSLFFTARNIIVFPCDIFKEICLRRPSTSS